MLSHIFVELGAWVWMALGFALLAAELVLPGFFLLWIGVAAILTGTLSLQLWSFSYWGWEIQVLIFLVLSLASAFVGKQVMSYGGDSDQPLLNRRDQQLVGRTATLSEPISDGSGRIRLGDTLWRVSGPDLPAGSRVRVKSAVNGELVVEAVSEAA